MSRPDGAAQPISAAFAKTALFGCQFTEELMTYPSLAEARADHLQSEIEWLYGQLHLIALATTRAEANRLAKEAQLAVQGLILRKDAAA